MTTPKMDNAGTRTVIRLHYKQITLSPNFSGMTVDASNWYPYVVDAIYYPGTGTGYWFGADPNASDYSTYYSSYGMIAKVLEQRSMGWSAVGDEQGTVSQGTMSKQAVYEYPSSSLPLTDAPTYPKLTESWAGMNTAPAETTYDIHNDAYPRTITVTQPNGVKSKQTSFHIAPTDTANLWMDGLIYQDETLDTANNRLSKSFVTVRWFNYSAQKTLCKMRV